MDVEVAYFINKRVNRDSKNTADDKKTPTKQVGIFLEQPQKNN